MVRSSGSIGKLKAFLKTMVCVMWTERFWGVFGRVWSRCKNEEHGVRWCWQIDRLDGVFGRNGSACDDGRVWIVRALGVLLAAGGC